MAKLNAGNIALLPLDSNIHENVKKESFGWDEQTIAGGKLPFGNFVHLFVLDFLLQKKLRFVGIFFQDCPHLPTCQDLPTVGICRELSEFHLQNTKNCCQDLPGFVENCY